MTLSQMSVEELTLLASSITACITSGMEKSDLITLNNLLVLIRDMIAVKIFQKN